MLNVTGAGWKRNDAKNKKRKSTGIFPLMRLRSGSPPPPPLLAARRSVAHQRLKSNERRRHGSAATRLWVHRLSAREERGNLLPGVLHGLNIYIYIRANDWTCFLSLWRIWLRVSEAGKYFGSVRTILFSCGRYSWVCLNLIGPEQRSSHWVEKPPWRQAPPNAGQETVVKVSRKCLHTRLL